MTVSRLSLLAATLLAATPALAADLTYEPAPVAAPASVYNWTGFYIGLNAGYGWGDIDTTDNSMTTTGPLVGVGQGSFPSTTFPGADGSASVDGLLGGAQIGYNYQVGTWVFGAEADYQAVDHKTSSSFVGSDLGPYYETSAELQSFGTVRGRIGYAIGDRGTWLPYVTGGLAYGETKISGSGTLAGGAATAFSVSDVRVGWVVGAGIEWAFADRWSAKLEYLFMDLGSDPGIVENTTTTVTTGRMTDNIARVGVNLHF